MIVGIGMDLVRVKRIERILAHREERFLQRVFTGAERALCPAGALRVRYLAARFAGKEAVLKALGTGLAAGVRWRDIEISRGPGGRPVVALYGRAAAIAAAAGIVRVHLSLSHDGPLAAAFAVAEGRGAG